LLYHGKGYTHSDVDAMSFDTFVRAIGRLTSQLKAEEEARREHEAKMKQLAQRRNG